MGQYLIQYLRKYRIRSHRIQGPCVYQDICLWSPLQIPFKLLWIDIMPLVVVATPAAAGENLVSDAQPQQLEGEGVTREGENARHLAPMLSAPDEERNARLAQVNYAMSLKTLPGERANKTDTSLESHSLLAESR